MSTIDVESHRDAFRCMGTWFGAINGQPILDGPMQATCYGIHDGKAWIGLGQHRNPDGSEVVAPAIAVYLPTRLDVVAMAHPEPMTRPASADLVLRLCREAVTDLPVVVRLQACGDAVLVATQYWTGMVQTASILRTPHAEMERSIARWSGFVRAEVSKARRRPSDCPVCPVALGGVCSRCSDGEPLTEAKPTTARPQPAEPTVQSGVMVVPQRFDTEDSCIGWAEGMERHLGKPGAVDAIQCHYGVMVALVHNWWWPLSALRLASESPKALPPGYTFEVLDGRCDVRHDGRTVFLAVGPKDTPEHYGHGDEHREAFAWAQALLRDGPPAGYLFRVMSSTEVQVTREMTGDYRAWYCLYRDKPELRPAWLTQSEHQAALGWALRLMGAT